MKKLLATILIGGSAVVLFAAPATAHHWRCAEPPDSIVTASLCIFNPWSVGFKQRAAGNIYITGTMDYLKSDRDLRFQLGTAYRIPCRILIFRPYGGGGLEFFRNHDRLHPYIAVGLEFWIFYSEVSHPLRRDMEPTTRFGFRFSF